jgi:hypothetical protein
LDFPFAGDGFIQQQSRGPYDCPMGWVRLRLEVTQDLKWFLVRFNRQNNSNHAAASIYENDIDIQNRQYLRIVLSFSIKSTDIGYRLG